MAAYFETDAIEISQPLGQFYIAAIPARVLLDTCFSKRISARLSSDGRTYLLDGAQREISEDRLKRIGAFIDRNDAALPNSVILAANVRQTDNAIERDASQRWSVSFSGDTGRLKLVIPQQTKLAQIVDGQHRLFGFRFAEANRLELPLVCSVYLDLPEPLQAQLFATINSTQKRVDRSITYELFGYNIDEEEPKFWGPDKLAVFLARKLNNEKDSPLEKRILVAAENEFVLTRAQARADGRWMISMATAVDGIMALFSKGAIKDINQLSTDEGLDRRGLEDDKSPLRQLYRDGNDKLIYSAVYNYFSAMSECVWTRVHSDAFILKTVGFQAAFDVLVRHLASIGLEQKNFSKEFFVTYLEKADAIEFSDNFLSNASGVGRSRMRRCLEVCLGFIEIGDLPVDDREEYLRVTNL